MGETSGNLFGSLLNILTFQDPFPVPSVSANGRNEMNDQRRGAKMKRGGHNALVVSWSTFALLSHMVGLKWR